MTSFPDHAPVAYPVFYRTYSRSVRGQRESWQDVCDRTIRGLEELGKLTPEEVALIDRMQRELKCLCSGRWLWVGGTAWVSKPVNFSGAYNCTSTNIVDWRSFGLLMDLAMQGSGTGAVLELHYIDRLPVIRNRLNVQVVGTIGATPKEKRREETEVRINGNRVEILVGDSRKGWVTSYQTLLELSADERFNPPEIEVVVDISDIRPSGEPLSGFGGVANPVKLPGLYDRCAYILNKAIGRKLNSLECCLLIDEAAVCVVAGNIRRCLPEDALVHTARGLVPIKDVQIGDLVQTPIGFRRVVNKFDQGMQEVHEIETNATFPRATLNHRMAVLSDAKGGFRWKYVGALEENDRLLHNTQVLPGTVTALPIDNTAARRTAKPIVIPPLTPDVAWLIGFTQGDGYIALAYGKVEWAMDANQPELCQKLQAKIDRVLSLFGVTATHTTINKTICCSIRLAEYFYQHIKQPNTPLQIPSFILQGSIDVRSAYLAGLMDSDAPCLVTSVYKTFIRQVGAVLSSLGIAGRLSINLPKEDNWQIKYNLTIPYNALIAPHSVKGELHQGLTIPGEMMRATYAYSEMREGSRSYERYISEFDGSISVKGLGSQDYVQTYDIEVEEAHCFYCDGFFNPQFSRYAAIFSR
jgi:ribonucleotide reductase class II